MVSKASLRLVEITPSIRPFSMPATCEAASRSLDEEFFNHLLSTRVKNNESLPRSSSLSQVLPFSFS